MAGKLAPARNGGSESGVRDEKKRRGLGGDDRRDEVEVIASLNDCAFEGVAGGDDDRVGHESG